MDYPSIERLAQLQQLIADFAKVKRMPHLADNGQPENDVEHSFGLALTCWYLQPKIAPELDIGEILKLALAHDIVELHAGDTFSFDKVNTATKESRERVALTKIDEAWPDFPELSNYAKDYMEKLSEEAKFVKAVDKLLPPLMVELGEKSVFWHQHKITIEMEREQKVALHTSRYLSPYYEMLLDWLDQQGNLYQKT